MGSSKKKKKPKPSPLIPATVRDTGQSSAPTQQNRGRQAQSILDPMQAQDDQKKDILG